MQKTSSKVWKPKTPVLHINFAAYTRIAFLKCPYVQKFTDRLDLKGLDPGKSDVKGSLA